MQERCGRCTHIQGGAHRLELRFSGGTQVKAGGADFIFNWVLSATGVAMALACPIYSGWHL